MVKKNGTYDSYRQQRRRREPLASSSRGESQSLKCVRELLYPHADGTLLLLAQASVAITHSQALLDIGLWLQHSLKTSLKPTIYSNVIIGHRRVLGF